MNKKRGIYIGCILLIIALGLASRTSICPAILYPYLGDVFYGTMFFFIVAFIFPKHSSSEILVMSVLICFSIEFSQILQSEWIVAIRNTTLGALVLGSGFLWSDLLCYFIGGVIGFKINETLIPTFNYENQLQQ